MHNMPSTLIANQPSFVCSVVCAAHENALWQKIDCNTNANCHASQLSRKNHVLSRIGCWMQSDQSSAGMLFSRVVKITMRDPFLYQRNGAQVMLRQLCRSGDSFEFSPANLVPVSTITRTVFKLVIKTFQAQYFPEEYLPIGSSGWWTDASSHHHDGLENCRRRRRCMLLYQSFVYGRCKPVLWRLFVHWHIVLQCADGAARATLYHPCMCLRILNACVIMTHQL